MIVKCWAQWFTLASKVSLCSSVVSTATSGHKRPQVSQHTLLGSWTKSLPIGTRPIWRICLSRRIRFVQPIFQLRLLVVIGTVKILLATVWAFGLNGSPVTTKWMLVTFALTTKPCTVALKWEPRHQSDRTRSITRECAALQQAIKTLSIHSAHLPLRMPRDSCAHLERFLAPTSLIRRILSV